MKNLFKKLTAVLIFTLMIGASYVMASGKMEVRIGQRVHLIGNSKQPTAEYKWVVKKGNDIIYIESDRNFYYNFLTQGEYEINLTAKSNAGVENATIRVLAGERWQRASDVGGEVGDLTTVIPLRLNLETLPYRTADGRLTLFGAGKVYFNSENSFGEILEYRIDKNVFEDSDGNGTANDDIDNSNDDSYLTGGPWITDYSLDGTAQIVAEVTIVDQTGKKAKEQVEIVFDERSESGEPLAILDSAPASQAEDSLIHLYNNPHRVAFYARRSSGKILEYRIDQNIFVDSDGDGDPKNDIDNLNDISFKTGDVWEASYAETEDQIIAQLIVVGEGGKGSRVQKGIVFGEKPLPPAPTLADIQEIGGIRLIADKDFVVKGDPITFTVAGLLLGLESYTFAWDFDGDGEMDKETEGENSVEHIYEVPGVFEVKVMITDQEGNTADYTLEMLSKDTELTRADFTFTQVGNTVQFEDFSIVSTHLASKLLDYKWSFGDTDEVGYEAQKNQIELSDPVYTYAKAGKYLVTLTITDSDLVTDSKSLEIEILQDAAVAGQEPVVDGPEVEDVKEGGNIFIRLIKIFLYLLLIVIALVVLILGGFMIFLKIQHPELTFEELVDELKAKLLSMLGVHEKMGAQPAGISGGAVLQQPPMSTEQAPTEPAPVESETPSVESETPSVESETPEDANEVVEPPVAGVGPTPDWLKGTEVIEGEVEEEEEAPAPPVVPPVDEGKPKGGGDENEPPEPPVGGESADTSDESVTPPGGESAEPPMPETDAPASEKGPTPDWLKGA